MRRLSDSRLRDVPVSPEVFLFPLSANFSRWFHVGNTLIFIRFQLLYSISLWLRDYTSNEELPLLQHLQ
jgi:hypothetical protein